MILQLASSRVSPSELYDQSYVIQDPQKLAETIKQALSPLKLNKTGAGDHTQQVPRDIASLEDRLFEARASCKIKTAAVAMYLPSEWRSRFFSQLDDLMDAENWEDDDTPITEASFATLLRMLLLIWPVRRPGLGATSEGHIIATWSIEKDRLTIECLPGDRIRWVVNKYIEGNRESAAGDIPLTRLNAVLAPYDPECWFVDAS
ncbi:hypothetical protein [Methylobacter marinus]|uniref:hypothetical protein n=1 Tax=Methylobacter marinus TaxID=34058 RepID=UPI00035FBD1B|nr:hypothetical protein [Methylobacter marinus]